MRWKISKEPVEYQDAVEEMERIVAGIHEGTGPETVWFLEHPPLYTGGTSAKVEDLRNPGFPVHYTGRGGKYTYHGPGQRVGYVMMDLKQHQEGKPDIRKFVHDLEEWIIQTLACFDVKGERREGRVGIWVDTLEGEKKIAALGVRIRHWITFHGISINVNPDLSHYDGIVPCGLDLYGTTSLEELLGQPVSMDFVDQALKMSWAKAFGYPVLMKSA